MPSPKYDSAVIAELQILEQQIARAQVDVLKGTDQIARAVASIAQIEARLFDVLAPPRGVRLALTLGQPVPAPKASRLSIRFGKPVTTRTSVASLRLQLERLKQHKGEMHGS